jgi:hypothetical protein
MLVSAVMDEEGNPVYKKQRDAFFRISPKSDVNRKSIKMALEGRSANFIIDGDDFIVIGEDALHMANERNMEARRPMRNGVLSPKEKASLPMIKLIIKSLIGKADDGEKLIFSVPATPIDGDFDIYYHAEMMKAYIKEMGFTPEPLNEGFAIAFAELLDDNLTGMCLSFGAGMVNSVVVYEGDPVVKFSVTKGGDWIDQAVAKALDHNTVFVQIEKEESNFNIITPEGKIQEALAVYYNHLINYSLDNIVYELKRARLPSFREPIPVILSGGLTLAGGFTEKFKLESENKTYPFEIKEIRQAEDPMTCVARGCLMAAIL